MSETIRLLITGAFAGLALVAVFVLTLSIVAEAQGERRDPLVASIRATAP